ncbi:threonylcarbamoyl-AMP synthase [Ferruginibacter lapsinanis]|uniref:L-threonylcarbamoyladenylate synthase n=1 Tax=Ferruginibacter lapsinanis TaxID=563172 RepID=UPI001E32F273|nr:L-threonylcarbamoyladenylate synthase [Ferruginibacter lapsinanis]UEG49827.1 threonylcarbamoyl-AMP synthase [Ferruginibacter lapsinanis]
MDRAFENDIENCITVLEAGGTILYPTDTIWGIGCDATNADAVSKVYQLKNRPDEKSLIILLADERDILTYVTQPNPEIFDYIKGIQKPTTVIYEGAIGLAENLISADGSIAIRIVKDLFCKHLIKRFRKPIVSTSANISGYPSPLVYNDIDIKIKKGVDYIVQHRQEDMAPSNPSAIVKLNKDGSFTVIRP